MLDDGRALALKLKADISPLLGDPDVDLQDESHWRRHTRQFYFRKALLPRIESPAKLSKLHPSSGNRRRCGRRPLGGRRPYQGCDLDGSKSPLEAASRCMDRSGPAYRFEKARSSSPRRPLAQGQDMGGALRMILNLSGYELLRCGKSDTLQLV